MPSGRRFCAASFRVVRGITWKCFFGVGLGVGQLRLRMKATSCLLEAGIGFLFDKTKVIHLELLFIADQANLVCIKTISRVEILGRIKLNAIYDRTQKISIFIFVQMSEVSLLPVLYDCMLCRKETSTLGNIL